MSCVTTKAHVFIRTLSGAKQTEKVVEHQKITVA